MTILNRAATDVEVLPGPVGLPEQVDPQNDAPESGLRAPGLPLNAALFKDAMRQPLVHFMLAGAAILTLSSIFGHSGAAHSQNRIQVSAAEIDRLREIWFRQWGHAPDAKQIDNLVQDYVREEIYYREALASGLDKEDTIIRRRLVEKIEFLGQEIASGEPSDADLQQFFASH